MVSGIYCYENLNNGKKYVGQAVNLKHRINEHERNFSKNTLGETQGENEPLWYAVKRYGRNNFDLFIVEECLLEELDDLEEYYIKELKSHKTEWGYNILWRGFSRKGISTSQETKDHLSDVFSGDGNPMYGKFGEDHPAFGYRHTEEFKSRLSEIKKVQNSGENAPLFGKKRKGSSSEYFGVCRMKDYKNWEAKTIQKGKCVVLGRYKLETDAARIYDRYIIENELSNPLNFPDDIETTLTMEIVRETRSTSQTGKKGKNASSQYYGVSKLNTDRTPNIWRATVWVDGKDISVGNFPFEIQAAKARDKYVFEHCLNKPLNFPEDYE